FAPQDAVVETVGDTKFYPIDKPATIREGETPEITLFRPTDIPVKAEYFLPGDSGYDDFESEETRPLGVFIRLRSVNNKEHHLGFALPAAAVAVLQPDGQGEWQKVNGSSLRATSDGEKLKLEFEQPAADVK